MAKKLFAPGRTELGGNHTDHQNGRILASAIDLGVYAVCTANGTDTIHIESDGFEPVELKTYQTSIRPEEFGTPKALVRGMISEFTDYGLNVGGFSAKVKNNLPIGSGLSSSAAFSVLLGRILSELFNNGEVPAIVLARTAHNAENRFFGKPSGLMDPLACALGSTVYVDFKTMEIEPITADFGSMGLKLCLTDTGGSHAGLDTSYARIPADMVLIANMFSCGVLADVDPAAFRAKGWNASDRPVRRAMHFFDENERVPLMRDALKAGNGEEYMRLMNASGRSSENLLNNIITSATEDTKLYDGLELSRRLLEGKGAWRVHGGGFAGSVQALMPVDYYDYYKAEMEKQFGAGSCHEIKLL